MPFVDFHYSNIINFNKSWAVNSCKNDGYLKYQKIELSIIF